ncbi:MAG: FKBP-type peptidyl-prolyl cis-trans isomerase [Deltaproteobacteria bacterium]|nr:FKBP-type peptidyl-prolyl cis-trans isomerase [Deltaproteobacteria bacterium]
MSTSDAPTSGGTSAKPASFAHPDHPGLQITDLKVGSGPEVKPGDTIEVNYVGTLEDGTVFDQTQSGPATFAIGKGMLIKGWDAGVPGMRVGGVRRLFVPASLGYGQKGAPPKIPPYAALIFEIELLAIK